LNENFNKNYRLLLERLYGEQKCNNNISGSTRQRDPGNKVLSFKGMDSLFWGHPGEKASCIVQTLVPEMDN
jgi:hypothetical protein